MARMGRPGAVKPDLHMYGDALLEVEEEGIVGDVSCGAQCQRQPLFFLQPCCDKSKMSKRRRGAKALNHASGCSRAHLPNGCDVARLSRSDPTKRARSLFWSHRRMYRPLVINMQLRFFALSGRHVPANFNLMILPLLSTVIRRAPGIKP